MAQLFSTGRVVDLLFLFIALEILAFSLVRRRRKRGMSTLDLVASLAAGACLLLALRAALLGVAWPQIAALLLLALLAHLLDVARRWTAP